MIVHVLMKMAIEVEFITGIGRGNVIFVSRITLILTDPTVKHGIHHVKTSVSVSIKTFICNVIMKHSASLSEKLVSIYQSQYLLVGYCMQRLVM